MALVESKYSFQIEAISFISLKISSTGLLSIVYTHYK